MAWRRTFYPGFFGALFLVLLRIAIGWHFLYEGCEKLESHRRGSVPFSNERKVGRPFSAAEYLRNATGPLAPYFRGIVPDVNGLAKLDADRLQARWTGDVRRITDHYRFETKQRDEAQAVLDKSVADARLWQSDQEWQEKRTKFYRELGAVQAVERDPAALSFQRERAAARRKDLDADRKDLIKDLDAIGGALREAVAKIATPEQKQSAGPYAEPRSTLDWIDLATMWGLVAMGLGLILGLLTRPAALAGAVFLGQIYLSMPPWPGLPPNPLAEGHYFIVNKNLIEMLACMALVFLPTGHWVGLDAVLFGKWHRRRLVRDLEREAAEHERDRERRTHTVSRPGSY